MAHFCNDYQGIESFTFLDDHEGNKPLKIVNDFNKLDNVGDHRPIVTKTIQLWGIDFITLNWEKAQ